MSLSSEEPTLIRSLKGHKESIITLDLYPSCKYVASAGMDNIIFLWNLTKKMPPVKLIGHKSQIHDLKFSPTGNIIVSASNDQSLKFWDIGYQSSGKQATLIKAHNARIRGISFSCDGLLLASCGDDKLIKVWSTIDRRLQYSLKKHNNWVRHCQFSPTAGNLASCDDKYAHIWDINTKKTIQTYSEHSGVIHRVKFHSLGNCLATCSHDTKIKLYDLRSQSVIQTYEGHNGAVKSIDFHPNSPYLISSSDDGTTKIWNSKKAQLQYTIQCHSNTTRFSRLGDYFITGGSQKVIHVWKTGFYDSLNEKILCGGETNQTQTRRRIKNHEQQKKSRKLLSNHTEESDDQCKTKTQIMNPELNSGKKVLDEKNQDEEEDERKVQILYNHDDEVFETQCKGKYEGRSIKSIGQLRTSKKLENIIPEKLLIKMRKISYQLEFITKTTQILQTRIQNNGQQLRRLVQLTNDCKENSF